MSESAKTIGFVVLGAAALLAAYFIDRPTQAVNVQALVGQTLNNDFEVDAPRRLKIVKFDRQTATTRQFEVAALEDGWSIPSKQDYPADATQQMAAAANALIDRKILRVVAENADSHAQFGVVDPMSTKLDSNSEGVGTRVIMTDADDKQLVDMIIGKKVKDAEGQRYVRKSNQDVVYVVELDPKSLSTDFNDWIEKDLLKLSPFDIRRVFINDYTAELGLQRTPDGQIAPVVNLNRQGELTLTYDNAEAKWNLGALKKFDQAKKQMLDDSLAADEELNQDALGELRNGLDELQIVDIARKPEGLSADLKSGGDFLQNEEAAQDLAMKGFLPVPLKPGAPPEILSSEGEVVCTLRDGVEYVLRFGQLKVHDETAGEGQEAAASPDASAAEADQAEEKTEDGKNLRRYLFVMARFNEDIIEKPKLKELPAAPTDAGEAAGDAQPATPPAGETPSDKPAETPAASEAAPAAGGDEPAAADKAEPTDETSPDDAKVADNAEKPADAPATDDAKKEPTPEDKLAEERKAIETENQRLQDQYKETVEGGKKKVAELNERFGDWYYVISNDVFKQIHLGREQVVKKKDAKADAASAAGAGEANPLLGLPKLPLGEANPAPAAESAEPAAAPSNPEGAADTPPQP